MEKRITGFIFGIIAGFVGCIAAFVGLLNWLSKNNCEDIVASFFNWVKDSIQRKPNYVASYYDYYNKYSSSARFTYRRLHDIMNIEFKSREEAEEVKKRILDTLNDFGKITVEELLTILGSKEIVYLDSKFGWYKVGCESETIQVLSVPCKDLWYISMPCPPVKIA